MRPEQELRRPVGRDSRPGWCESGCPQVIQRLPLVGRQRGSAREGLPRAPQQVLLVVINRTDEDLESFRHLGRGLSEAGARVLSRPWDDDFSAARNAGSVKAMRTMLVVPGVARVRTLSRAYSQAGKDLADLRGMRPELERIDREVRHRLRAIDQGHRPGANG